MSYPPSWKGHAGGGLPLSAQGQHVSSLYPLRKLKCEAYLIVSCKQDKTLWAGALHAQQSTARAASLDTVHRMCQGRTLSPFGGVLSKIYQTNPKWWQSNVSAF